MRLRTPLPSLPSPLPTITVIIQSASEQRVGKEKAPMSPAGTGGRTDTDTEKRLMGDEMFGQEVQGKDVSWPQRLSGASGGCSSRAGNKQGLDFLTLTKANNKPEK
ncbi:uncharacterized protein V6R79_017127 [Siganus canaliculatus]